MRIKSTIEKNFYNTEYMPIKKIAGIKSEKKNLPT